MATMAIMTIIVQNGGYGDYGHNDHNSLIRVSIEAYGLQESSPALQNPLKYVFQI